MKKLIALGVALVVLLGWAFFEDAPPTLPAEGSDAEPAAEEKKEEEMTGTDKEPLAVEVPIFVYHHFSDTKKGYTTSAKFRQDMEELKALGYETIFYDDLYEYVYYGGDLPDKPVIVSFDDGYLSNYELAFPILQELEMKAEISLIGCLVGKVIGEAHWLEMNSYVTWSQAKEMQDSGLVRFQTHTYKMHECEITGEADMLSAVKDDADEYDYYRKFFFKDDEKMKDLFAEHLRYTGITFTYPLGRYDEVTEELITEMGYRISVGVETGVNTVERGNPQSLRMLKRINLDDYGGGTIKNLIKYIKNQENR